MSPDDLKSAAIEIFGQRGWTTDLADRLKIDRTTVYRYVNNQIPIPGPVDAAVSCWLAAFRRDGQRP